MRQTCRLLIVDDDPSQIALIEELLETLKLPHHCHSATTGGDALRFLRKGSPFENAQRPDLILLDLNLPGQRGDEVLREIKADVRLRSIPVIIMSTSDRPEDVHACYDSYANAYVSKSNGLDSALQIVSAIDLFWMQTAELVRD